MGDEKFNQSSGTKQQKCEPKYTELQEQTARKMKKQKNTQEEQKSELGKVGRNLYQSTSPLYQSITNPI